MSVFLRLYYIKISMSHKKGYFIHIVLNDSLNSEFIVLLCNFRLLHLLPNLSHKLWFTPFQIHDLFFDNHNILSV